MLRSSRDFSYQFQSQTELTCLAAADVNKKWFIVTCMRVGCLKKSVIQIKSTADTLHPNHLSVFTRCLLLLTLGQRLTRFMWWQVQK